MVRKTTAVQGPHAAHPNLTPHNPRSPGGRPLRLRLRSRRSPARRKIDRSYRGKHLQVYYTIEDEGVFTTPWSATVTYGRGSDDWPETACAENFHVYYDKDEMIPMAAKPDF